MVKHTIRIFCRLKPTNQPQGIVNINENETAEKSISFSVPKDQSSGYINNKKEIYRFRFDHLFDTQIKQDEIFNVVAAPVIDSVLTGYNGTIFAYGQTGSGKTFTITGGPERYIDRGIIPRSLSHIFNYYKRNSNLVFTTYISYLEIYNENGYDLLDPRHEAAKLEDLPKVSLLEDTDGNIHLKNLSLHQANSEEDALNLLFLGDTNRMIAETPMNQASTRSHCIFTIHVTVKEMEAATIRRSKLHLVDLAGSERVSKTGVNGILLKEAKYINLSLHYLEQVIIALSEKTRSHVPYRNSMMTSVLRDSLGGNCMTSMIATCSIDKHSIDESISTCRFAQRVALIRNEAMLNEEIDPQLVIARLKNEIQELRDELSLATGQEYHSDLEYDEKERLENDVKQYLNDSNRDSQLMTGADMRKVKFCFSYMKELYLNKSSGNQNHSYHSPTMQSVANDDPSYLAKQSDLEKLRDLVRQRDNEINILVGILKKERQKIKNQPVTLPSNRITQKNQFDDDIHQYSRPDMITSPSNLHSSRSDYLEKTTEHSNDIKKARLNSLQKQTKVEMSVGRQEAFENFKQCYPEANTIDGHKVALKKRYSDAKLLGEKVNNARLNINTLKGRLEKHRNRRSVQGMEDETEQEISIRSAIDDEKKMYKDAFNDLKALKTEIEHLQFLLEKSRAQMQRDFDEWWIKRTSSDEKETHDDLQSSDRPCSNLTVSSRHDSSQLHHSRNDSNTESNTSSETERSINNKPMSNFKLTGNADVDAQIMAFVAARQKVISQQGGR